MTATSICSITHIARLDAGRALHWGNVPDLPTTAALLPGLLAAFGVLFCALALWSARSFARDSRGFAPEHPASPPVSILKPIKGEDPGLLQALRTHCTQDYPGEVELLCAVHALDDPAVPSLRALAAEFPAMRIEVVETPLVLGANGKMSNLAQLAPHARHELLLIADADIAVGRKYLRRITAPFIDRGTGLVTAPYRGRTHPQARPTLGSRLEALAIATDFAPGVFTSRFLDRGMQFALGSTLLVSRTALAASGGLEALTGVLADDYVLGQNVLRAGYRIVLSPEVVSTAVPAYTLGCFWQHQLRWARTVRDVRPGSYFGLIFTHPVPWALLYAAATGCSLPSILVLLLALLARLAVAIMVGYGLLGDRQVLRDLALMPVRDCVALALWVWSYAGDTIEWRGEQFRVRKGRLVRVARF